MPLYFLAPHFLAPRYLLAPGRSRLWRSLFADRCDARREAHP